MFPDELFEGGNFLIAVSRSREAIDVAIHKTHAIGRLWSKSIPRIYISGYSPGPSGGRRSREKREVSLEEGLTLFSASPCLTSALCAVSLSRLAGASGLN